VVNALAIHAAHVSEVYIEVSGELPQRASIAIWADSQVVNGKGILHANSIVAFVFDA
jgi:hypothetical protein